MKIRRIWKIESLDQYGYYRLHATDRSIDIEYRNTISVYPDFIAMNRHIGTLDGKELTLPDLQALGLDSATAFAALSEKIATLNVDAPISDTLPSLEHIHDWQELNSFFAQNEACFHYHDFVFHYAKRKKTNDFRLSMGHYEKVAERDPDWKIHVTELKNLYQKLQEYPLMGDMANARAMIEGVLRGEDAILTEYYAVNASLGHIVAYADFRKSLCPSMTESIVWL